MRQALVLTMACGLIAGLAGPAKACRGMAHHVLPWMDLTGPLLTFSSEMEHVTFDLDGATGSYTAIYPRVELIWSNWSVGALVPLVDLRKDGFAGEQGVGNPRVYGQATLWEPLGLRAGVELDLPWGESEVAGDHAEIIPFFSIDRMGTTWGAFASVGYRASLGSGHAHAALSQHGERAANVTKHGDPEHEAAFHADPGHDDPGHDDGSGDHDREQSHDSGSIHPVDPHSERELLYRAGVARNWGDSSIRAFVEGQSVLEDIPGPRQFTAVGLELGIPAFGLLWVPGVEVPIGPDRRLDSSVRLGVHALF
jgi:hypothetical protein